jgi:tRNA A37 threonylcarbamoyladenosine dehydratase
MAQAKIHYQRRFGGITKLYGKAAFSRFAKSHVGIIGLGGVGSWAGEAMARSGIGGLTLFDLDNVVESNVNRQIHALSEELGRPKVDVMRQRIEAINPRCEVTAIEDFVTVDNLEPMLNRDLDYVIDCVDNFRTKAAIIAHCKRAKIRVITIGGAGGLIDPTRISVADLTRASQDALLGRTRRYLRYKYDFSRNPRRRFDIPCVYSTEQVRYPDSDGGTCRSKPEAAAGGLSCAGTMGSVMTVTASFGLVAAAHVLNRLAATATD